jgi:hypothetical protein
MIYVSHSWVLIIWPELVWTVSFALGVGIGAICLHGLRGYVRGLVSDRGPRRIRLSSSAPVRVALAGALFCGLGRYGLSAVAAALIGMWLTRSWLLWHMLQGAPHAD